MRQHLRSEEIEVMLIRHGFEERHRKGSHATWANTEFPDLVFVLQHRHGANNSNIDNQKDAAKICIQVQERRTDALEAQKKSLAQTFTAQAAAPTASDGRVDILSMLPAHITTTPKDGYMILRHSSLSCIGIVAAARDFPDAFIETFRHIDERAQALNELLRNAVKEYDLKIGTETDGTRTVLQPTYRMGRKLKPFDPDSIARVEDELAGFFADIKSCDDHYSAQARKFIDQAKAGNDVKSRELPGDQVEWTIMRQHFLSGERRPIRLITSRNFRIHPADSWELQDTIYNFDLGPRDDNRAIRKKLVEHYGARVERPADPTTGRPGRKMICSHALYKDIQCEIILTEQHTSLKKICLEYLDESDPDKSADLFFLLAEISDTLTKAHKALDKFTDAIVYRMMEEQNECIEILKAAAIAGFKQACSPSNAKPGENVDLIFTHPHVAAPVRIPAVRLGDTGEISRLSDLKEKLWPHVLTRKESLLTGQPQVRITNRWEELGL